MQLYIYRIPTLKKKHFMKQSLDVSWNFKIDLFTINEVLPSVALNVLIDEKIKSANESAERNSLQIYRVLKLVDTFL